MSKPEVAQRFTRDLTRPVRETRKGECCKTCKSWKKGFVMVPNKVTGEDEKVETMMCKSPQRFPKGSGAGVPESPKGWCGWWEK